MNNPYVHAFVLLLDHNLSIHITKIYIKFALHHEFAYSAISALMPSCIYSVRDISSWTVHVMCIHVHVYKINGPVTGYIDCIAPVSPKLYAVGSYRCLDDVA